MYQYKTCFTEASSILLTFQKNQLNGSEFGKLSKNNSFGQIEKLLKCIRCRTVEELLHEEVSKNSDIIMKINVFYRSYYYNLFPTLFDLT